MGWGYMRGFFFPFYFLLLFNQSSNLWYFFFFCSTVKVAAGDYDVGRCKFQADQLFPLLLSHTVILEEALFMNSVSPFVSNSYNLLIDWKLEARSVVLVYS